MKHSITITLIAFWFAIATGTSSAVENSNTPALPEGLFNDQSSSAQNPSTAPIKNKPLLGNLTGFIDSRVGYRLQDDPFEKDASLGEIRLQLANQWERRNVTARFTGDFLYDAVEDNHEVDLEDGRGWFDLREAYLSYRASSYADIRLGRQILTWGTGDLVFINDLFPKDFRSFFIGRDEEYLKAPSDAGRITLYHGGANLDVVLTPKFDADRSVDGSRLSYFNPNLGRTAGRDAIIDPDKPDSWFNDSEIALRTFGYVKAYEAAAYYYRGFWKSPMGQTTDGTAIYPPLTVWGASVRGPSLGGILNAEFGYYRSRDDTDGNNPLIANSEWRYLIGYQREVLPQFTVGLQYYAERKQDYEAYRDALPAGTRKEDQTHQVITLRLTKQAMQQNLTLSAFNYWSPNENDGYTRLRATYKVNDSLRAEVGGNIFYGKGNDRFFSQFKDNSNLFAGLRWSF